MATQQRYYTLDRAEVFARELAKAQKWADRMNQTTYVICYVERPPKAALNIENVPEHIGYSTVEPTAERLAKSLEQAARRLRSAARMRQAERKRGSDGTGSGYRLAAKLVNNAQDHIANVQEWLDQQKLASFE